MAGRSGPGIPGRDRPGRASDQLGSRRRPPPRGGERDLRAHQHAAAGRHRRARDPGAAGLTPPGPGPSAGGHGRPPGLSGGFLHHRRGGDRRHPGDRLLRGARLRAGVHGDPQRARPVRGGLERVARDGRQHRPGLPDRISPGRPARRADRGICAGQARGGGRRGSRPGAPLVRPAAAAGFARHAAQARPEAVHRACHPRGDRGGGRPDRGRRPGPAPGARRSVRHDRGARSPRLRHRPGDQGADAVRAAGGRARPARGADLERAQQRVDAQGQRRAGLSARPGLV